MTASDRARSNLHDPWLLDSESLLHELARVRELALRIPPVRNDIVGPINSVIDALWDLEERLRYCLHLRCAGQRAFARQHDKKLAKLKNRSQHGRAAPRPIIATGRSRFYMKTGRRPRLPNTQTPEERALWKSFRPDESRSPFIDCLLPSPI